MKTSWHDIWGSARGPVCALVPQVRIIGGASVLATCMVAPATRWDGVIVITTVVVAWALLVRPPVRIVKSTLLFGLIMFLPYFMFIQITYDPATGWKDALRVSWTVLFRGMTAMHASVYTATALSASALRQGLSRLPVPRVVSAVLLQIVHQTASLINESRQIASAIAVRGGTTGCRTAIRVLASLPRVWLPRVVERAERVGAAMDLRGYCEHEIKILGVNAISWKDRLALILAGATVAGVVALRIWGGA